MLRFWKVPVAMSDRPFAEYAARNAAPILEILRQEFRDATHVLELGSGTGQHAVAFAQELVHLQWQTSDLDENHAGIQAWIDTAQLDNVAAPLSLDVRAASVEGDVYDAVFSSNTAHIMGIEAVEKMFSLVGGTLRDGGVFCLYGPFKQLAAFNTTSNADFDSNLRSRNPVMGIRDIEELDEFADAAGMRRVRFYAVPSNNNVAVWCKGGDR